MRHARDGRRGRVAGAVRKPRRARVCGRTHAALPRGRLSDGRAGGTLCGPASEVARRPFPRRCPTPLPARQTRPRRPSPPRRGAAPSPRGEGGRPALSRFRARCPEGRQGRRPPFAYGRTPPRRVGCPRLARSRRPEVSSAGSRPSSDSTSCAISSTERGPSETVSAFRFPPPQSGRRSSSSGRAQQTTRVVRLRRGRQVRRRTRAGRRPPTEGRRSRARAAVARRATRGRCASPRKAEFADREAPRRPAQGRRAARGSRRPSGAPPRARVVHSRHELLRRTTASSFSWMPASALTISASAQNETPSPYGRQRPYRHVMIASSSSTSRASSATRRLLPIPGTRRALRAGSSGRPARVRRRRAATRARAPGQPAATPPRLRAHRRGRAPRPLPRPRPARPCPLPRQARAAGTRSCAPSRGGWPCRPGSRRRGRRPGSALRCSSRRLRPSIPPPRAERRAQRGPRRSQLPRERGARACRRVHSAPRSRHERPAQRGRRAPDRPRARSARRRQRPPRLR